MSVSALAIWHQSRSRQIKVKDTKVLLDVIGDIELGDSQLKLSRREAIRALTLSVKPAVFAQHFSLLFIEELVASDIVMSECRNEPIERYRIPDVEVKVTLAALIQSIKESKSTSAKTGELIDVVPLLRKVFEELRYLHDGKERQCLRGKQVDGHADLKSMEPYQHQELEPLRVAINQRNQRKSLVKFGQVLENAS
jgi:hypothetical protein